MSDEDTTNYDTSSEVDTKISTALSGAVLGSDYTPAHSLLVQQSGTGSPSIVSLGTGEFL